MADAWVIGNFADNESFAAVSSGGNLTFLIIGFFSGLAIGGSVVISRYFGAKDEKNTSRAIHANFLIAIIASVLATLVGLLLVPHILVWIKTPANVLPQSLAYFRVYFAGVATIIMYNTGMSVMRALGDSIHPLIYLAISSVVNVVLDILFVAVFDWGVTGAAVATVIAQGLSALLCIIQMLRLPEATRLSLRKLRFDGIMLWQVIRQGLPTGIQNAVISVGNIVIQSNINSFGEFAMSGHGAYSRIEGIVFLPIMCMSMSLPTFVSQNLGAGKIERAKKGALFGTLFGVAFAEAVGVLLYFFTPQMLSIFTKNPAALEFGTIHGRTVSLFFFLLAFSHCVAGVLRGCGKAIIPMIVMLGVWCGIRILYITIAIQYFPVFRTISAAYPITWGISSILYAISVLRLDWKKAINSL